MTKLHRFFPKIVAGLLAAGAAKEFMSDPAETSPIKVLKEAEEVRERSEPVVETAEVSDEKKEDFVSDELIALGVSPERLRLALEAAAQEVASHRFPHAAAEERYFYACTKPEWEKQERAVLDAAEKTGVPAELLFAIGFVESRFVSSAKRDDTQVHGPFQMTLATARSAAKDYATYFGGEKKVIAEEDLYDPEISARLCALRLRTLTEQYGQVGLAIVDYAGGRVGLEQKIISVFPEMDFGAGEWKRMEQFHATEQAAKKKRDDILQRNRPLSDKDRAEFKQAVREMEAASRAYILAKRAWNQTRAAAPERLKELGINIVTLYEGLAKKSPKIPHSVVYPLALEDMAKRARAHRNVVK